MSISGKFYSARKFAAPAQPKYVGPSAPVVIVIAHTILPSDLLASGILPMPRHDFIDADQPMRRSPSHLFSLDRATRAGVIRCFRDCRSSSGVEPESQNYVASGVPIPVR